MCLRMVFLQLCLLSSSLLCWAQESPLVSFSTVWDNIELNLNNIEFEQNRQQNLTSNLQLQLMNSNEQLIRVQNLLQKSEQASIAKQVQLESYEKTCQKLEKSLTKWRVGCITLAVALPVAVGVTYLIMRA